MLLDGGVRCQSCLFRGQLIDVFYIVERRKEVLLPVLPVAFRKGLLLTFQILGVDDSCRAEICL